MVAQGLVGLAFALFAGNTLAVPRPSGPVVAFIGIVFAQALSLQVDFLKLWAWVCIWLAIFLVLFAVADASYLIHFVSEFTEGK